jgi:mannosyltransferase
MTSRGYESSPFAQTLRRGFRLAGSQTPRVSPAEAAGKEQPAAEPRYWVVPPLVALAIQLWGIWEPAYSRDETATLSATDRPFGALVHMLHNVDVVHGTYYSIIWLVVRVAGTGEFATRLPSAIAMAVTAAVVYGLGRRLVSPRAGLAAGLVFAVIPQVSYWGQTARPYALETALAALASYVLVRAMQAAASGEKTYRWLIAGYGACLTALGYVQFLGLLLVVAHLVPVARTWQRHRADGNGRGLALGWAVAVLASFVISSPVIAAGIAQRGFGKSPVNIEFIKSLLGLIGSPSMAEIAGLAVLCSIAVSGFRGRARLRADWPGDMIALCVPWLILPPVICILESHGTPLYFRYLMFCAPAAALLLGAGLAALGWTAGAAVLLIFAALAWPSMLRVRGPDGHGGADIVAADQVIARDRRPGDVLMYGSINEPIEMARSYGMRQLRNIEVGESAIASGTLGGAHASRRVILRRAEAAHRIWLVQVSVGGQLTTTGSPLPKGVHFRKARTWKFDTLVLTLYVRD